MVAGAAAYLLCVMFASRMYFAMVSTELKNAAPRVLLHNMFCYCLGPSLLAPIPVAGPPLALLFIFLVWCVGGGKRLYISWRGAIVAAVLSMLLVARHRRGRRVRAEHGPEQHARPDRAARRRRGREPA